MEDEEQTIVQTNKNKRFVACTPFHGTTVHSIYRNAEFASIILLSEKAKRSGAEFFPLYPPIHKNHASEIIHAIYLREPTTPRDRKSPQASSLSFPST